MRAAASRLPAALALLVGSWSAAAPASAAPGSADVVGPWLTQTGDGVVTVERCGTAGEICGIVTGMVYEGAPPRDVWHRPQCGLNLLLGMRPAPDGGWAGQILDPNTGHRYSARIQLTATGSLTLRGYLVVPLFGETQTWTRFAGGPIGPDCRMAARGR